MKEINIGKTLIAKRKEKGITQDELAAYIGVSKASVSKWETGQSYPDITFLPRLAAYFNISVDHLIGYTPQLTQDQIRTLYYKMASCFADQPFDPVFEECEAIIKKYYSCFPLLLQMVVLYLNHHMLAPKERQEPILEEALALCARIKEESDDLFLSKDATMLEATCYLMLHKPTEVLALFGETLRPIHQETEAVAQAYLLMGNTEKSIEATQVSMYQHLLCFLGSSVQLLGLAAGDPARVDEIMKRTLDVALTFRLEALHPNAMAILTLTGAQIYCGLGNTQKALELLSLYAETCAHFCPYTLHGDAFFDSIDKWLQDFDLGIQAPRSESAIKKDLLSGVETNPAFAALKENPEFQTILARIKSILGGD